MQLSVFVEDILRYPSVTKVTAEMAVTVKKGELCNLCVYALCLYSSVQNTLRYRFGFASWLRAWSVLLRFRRRLFPVTCGVRIYI